MVHLTKNQITPAKACGYNTLLIRQLNMAKAPCSAHLVLPEYFALYRHSCIFP